MPTRLRSTVAALRPPAFVARPVGYALFSRLLVWVIAAVTMAMFSPRRNPHVAEREWDPQAFDMHTLAGHVARVGERWDSEWYIRIAGEGYGENPVTTAFFPLYPGLMALLGQLGIPLWLAGTLISLLALCAAAVVLHLVFTLLPGIDPPGARRGLLLWLFFPFSVVLGAIYPESLLVLFVALAWLFALRGQRVWCGVAVGLAMLTKSLGVAGFAFLLFTHARAGEGTQPWRQKRTWLGFAVACALSALWPLYLYLKYGNALTFAEAQSSWSREAPFLGPIGGLWESGVAGVGAIGAVFMKTLDLSPELVSNFEAVHGTGMQDILGLVALVGLAVASVWAWRWFGAGAGLANLVVVVIPLTATAAAVPLMSAPRFLVVALPLYAVLARATARSANPDLWTIASASLFGMVTTGWALWQWMG